jgi:hypothetical protein
MLRAGRLRLGGNAHVHAFDVLVMPCLPLPAPATDILNADCAEAEAEAEGGTETEADAMVARGTTNGK